MFTGTARCDRRRHGVRLDSLQKWLHNFEKRVRGRRSPRNPRGQSSHRLSELALLGTPALNFAFGDGADRYHTSHDDVAHLNKGSLQHHGQQALALTHAFANGPLPRQRTGDAVFFDLPAVGLVVYSEKWAMLLALVAAALAVVVIIRSRRESTRFGSDVVLGAAATIGAVVLSSAAAHLAGRIIALLHTIVPWGGAPAWSPVYWAAVAVLSLAISTACYVAVRRRGSVAGLHVWRLVHLDVTLVSRCGGLRQVPATSSPGPC